MPIVKPSQYDCDNMKPGDIIYVVKRSSIYKFIRKHFFKDKLKLNVKLSWNDNSRKQEYQEDCILMYDYELACIQNISKVPCNISTSQNGKPFYSNYLKSTVVSLYNIQLIFNNNLTITIPLSFIQNAIKQNEYKFKQLDNNRLIQESLKFSKYDGKYFKQLVKDNDINALNINYCQICGEPIRFNFTEDDILVKNLCKCGNITTNKTKMTYDEMAVWYYTLVDPIYKKYIDSIIFNKE